MNPTTPSGTRTRAISMPLGRRQTSTVFPTGSGSPATRRSPAAISSTRPSVSGPRPLREGPRLGAVDLPELGGVVVGQAARHLLPVCGAQRHDLAGVELPLHLHDARGEQALPPLDQGTPRPRVHGQPPLRRHGEGDPALAAPKPGAARNKVGAQ